MKSLQRLFWIFLVLAAFGYGFVIGSEEISMLDVEASVTNALGSMKDPAVFMEQPWVQQILQWGQAILEKLCSLICNFSKAMV